MTKNMAVLARLSRLKPIPNPLRFLNLQISEKILRTFNEALKMQVKVPVALELVHNPQTTKEQVILDCNPSLHVVNDTENGEQ